MSQSLRVSDELMEQAKRTAALFHRSPPQQIEFWAQIGQVMEIALSYHAQAKIKDLALHSELDDALAQVETPAGRSRAQDWITHNPSPNSRH